MLQEIKKPMIYVVEDNDENVFHVSGCIEECRSFCIANNKDLPYVSIVQYIIDVNRYEMGFIEIHNTI